MPDQPDNTAKPWDLIIYGATGFTGRQAARYIAASPDRSRMKVALAGRNADALASLVKDTGADGVVVADATDVDAIRALVASTRVVLTTAGPYAIHGDALAVACAEQGVHYCDITGETPWVKSLIDRCHATAVASGARIVPFCGFDSVPSDLGTWLLVEHFRALGESTREVKAFHRGQGGINGGTIASMLNMLQGGQMRDFQNPLLLTPLDQFSADEARRSKDPVLPFFDPDINAWAAPFFMGPINTRVVRRSRALAAGWQQDYGPGFTYQEYWKAAGGPLGGLEAAAMSTANASFLASARIRPLASLLERVTPGAGTGPSEQTMDNGWFTCELVGRSSAGRKASATLRDQGDPGNRATVKMLCESALALTLDQDQLPGADTGRSGILTPATALGTVLAQRLRSAGMTLTVTDG